VCSGFDDCGRFVVTHPETVQQLSKSRDYAQNQERVGQVGASGKTIWSARDAQREKRLEAKFKRQANVIAPDSRDIVIAYVLTNPVMTLEDLLRETTDRVSPDDIFRMIAANVVYVDLHAAPRAELSRVAVFVAQEMAFTAGGDGARQPQTSFLRRFSLWGAR
jgi:hypothetical protein